MTDKQRLTHYRKLRYLANQYAKSDGHDQYARDFADEACRALGIKTNKQKRIDKEDKAAIEEALRHGQ